MPAAFLRRRELLSRAATIGFLPVISSVIPSQSAAEDPDDALTRAVHSALAIRDLREIEWELSTLTPLGRFLVLDSHGASLYARPPRATSRGL